jgi:hypothetical protein
VADRRDATPRSAGQRATLFLTFLFVLVAVSVSVGLVVYTAWHHDLEDGFFALAFAILSTRAVLSWFLWRGSYQLSAISYQQGPSERKPADEPTQ